MSIGGRKRNIVLRGFVLDLCKGIQLFEFL